MGASHGHRPRSRQGRGEADKDKRILAVIGDSTFLHMGMQGLLDIVYNNSVTILLLDNRAVGMTGGQNNPGNGYDLYDNAAPRSILPSSANLWGQEGTHPYGGPYQLPVLFKTIRDEIKVPEVSVIITDQPCVPHQGLSQAAGLRGDRRQVHRLRQLHRGRLPGHPRHPARQGGQGQRPRGRSRLRAHRDFGVYRLRPLPVALRPPDAIVHYEPVSPIRLVKN